MPSFLPHSLSCPFQFPLIMRLSFCRGHIKWLNGMALRFPSRSLTRTLILIPIPCNNMPKLSCLCLYMICFCPVWLSFANCCFKSSLFYTINCTASTLTSLFFDIQLEMLSNMSSHYWRRFGILTWSSLLVLSPKIYP